LSEQTNTAAPQPESEETIRARLEKIKAYRGRVMPNHAVLAVEAPHLLDIYEKLYSSMTLTYYTLQPKQKKLIQLLVVSSSEVPLGAYHVKDFLAEGGTPEQVKAALRLAMFVIGSSTLDAVGPSWSQFVPGVTYAEFYGPELIQFALDSGLERWLVELALAVGYSTRRAWGKVGLHLTLSKQHGATDSAIAEGLTNLILTAGNPAFVQACGVWQKLIAEGKVEASASHRLAANMG
jgi:alkylhydroperoxidase/carboxymuconolactone decarboxylase family protein YurZ